MRSPNKIYVPPFARIQQERRTATAEDQLSADRVLVPAKVRLKRQFYAGMSQLFWVHALASSAMMAEDAADRMAAIS